MREFFLAVEDWIFKEESAFIGMGKLLLVIIALLFLVTAPFIYIDAKRPGFELKKDEWSCTASHAEQRRGGMLVGKIWVPTTYTVQVCDEYTRTR